MCLNFLELYSKPQKFFLQLSLLFFSSSCLIYPREDRVQTLSSTLIMFGTRNVDSGYNSHTHENQVNFFEILLICVLMIDI